MVSILLKLDAWLSEMNFLKHHDVVFDLFGLFLFSHCVVEGVSISNGGEIRTLAAESFILTCCVDLDVADVY